MRVEFQPFSLRSPVIWCSFFPMILTSYQDVSGEHHGKCYYGLELERGFAFSGDQGSTLSFSSQDPGVCSCSVFEVFMARNAQMSTGGLSQLRPDVENYDFVFGTWTPACFCVFRRLKYQGTDFNKFNLIFRIRTVRFDWGGVLTVVANSVALTKRMMLVQTSRVLRFVNMWKSNRVSPENFWYSLDSI